MAQRGVGGSGVELAARLGANQASADRMSRESDTLVQQAQQRAMDAMMNQANLGGQIRSQDYGEQSNLASARDAMNKFNTQTTIYNKDPYDGRNLWQPRRMQITMSMKTSTRSSRRTVTSSA